MNLVAVGELISGCDPSLAIDLPSVGGLNWREDRRILTIKHGSCSSAPFSHTALARFRRPCG